MGTEAGAVCAEQICDHRKKTGSFWGDADALSDSRQEPSAEARAFCWETARSPERSEEK